ncbi:MAG TPA: FAD-dependent oxidoreductase [Anaerolineales bacterium]|nr:FAD-dependent oxidoreductase [Anaerolineales bacterium]
MNQKTYVIVGTGAAGIGGAEAIRAHDPRGKIILVGDEPAGFYSRPGLAYYLTGEIPEEQLFPLSQAEFKQARFDWITATVLRIDRDNRKIVLDNGVVLDYDCLLLATGASSRKSDLQGADLDGVVELDNIEDARRILQHSRKAKRAVVLGGGITALEIVEGLVSRKVQVHYFLRGDRYWGNVLDETESKIVEHRLIEEGVRIHYNTDAEAILPGKGGLFGRKPDQVAGVLTKDGVEIPCEIVAVAIGVVPRIELARDARLEIDRGVLVDEGMLTSDPHIYAAGDIAQAYDSFAKRAVLDVLWPVARDQGRVAGANMAGGEAVYTKEVPLNVTRLAGLTTTIIGTVSTGGRDDDTKGIVRGDSETWRTIPDALVSQSGFDVNRIRLMVGEKTLLGAIVMGDQTLSSPIHRLVQDQVDISSIKDQLVDGTDVSGVISDFWSKVR